MNVTQAILPVAGIGTRFLPWTKAVPKELLPLGNRPIISYIVDECLDAGIKDICFVISHGKEIIPRYFADDPKFDEELKRRNKFSLIASLQRYKDVNFHIVYQEQMLGDGHAILQAAAWVKSPQVAVLFGDDFFIGAEPGIQQLMNVSKLIPEGECAIVAVENVPREATQKYGIIDIQEELTVNRRLKRVKGLVEKPAPEKAPSTFGIVGRYIIPRSIIETLPSVKAGKDGEIRLIDALIAKVNTLPIYGYECQGTRIDTGTPDGYRKAVDLLG